MNVFVLDIIILLSLILYDMGITDYLVQIQELTNTNLKLLKALNDSLITDKGYVSVSTDEGSFNIPSIIMLENKINTLQNNFENLVNAPVTSEANFIFNGDSRAIEVKRYEQSPASLTLGQQSEFYHENNDVLKDFLTPVPYLKFNLFGIPYDISTVDIRKVVALTDKIKNRFEQILGGETSKSVSWGDIYKLLADAEQDKDYVLYDTVTRLPIRKGQGNGQYVISSLGDMYIDENLDQHVIVTLANNKSGYQKGLTYTVFDQTIERDLAVGDYLVSWDGHAKFQIEELNFNTNTIKLKILYGDYINLTAYDPEYEIIDDTAKLRFFSNVDLFSDSNYAKVPLEEDQYIFVAIAPLNDRMNVRAAWGDGLLVDVYRLTTDEGTLFEEYYKNCRNIGDIMNEISKVMSNSVSRLSEDDVNKYMTAKPTLDEELIKVVHINKHLDESTTIKNIRALYSQKNNYNASLNETQTSLTALQDQLSSIDFQDTTGIRAKLQSQIDILTKKKNELINSLIKISDEIALTANNSVVPIENAKYRIRGFFDFVGFAEGLGLDERNIKGINVQYRYRNNQLEVGSADTFTKDRDDDGAITNDETFIFSDWNRLYTPLRPRLKTKDGYAPEENTSNENLPSFNQIDIPISQGESVDIRLKVIYDFGYPFIQMMSEWSDIMTIEFPVEFLKDVTVVDILKENNNDIETNRFKTILQQDGVTGHVEDSILDQDVLFFHKPENISSGFYTAERRIIPLRDKLKDMNDAIVRLSDEVEGSASESLGVNVDFDESSIQLSPFEVGLVTLAGYDNFVNKDSGQYGNYTYDGDDNGNVKIFCNIRLTNTSQHSLKIFSMFPATENIPIGSIKTSKFDIKDYTIGSESESDLSKYGVWYYDPSVEDEPNKLKVQTSNQIITFRVNNPYDATDYYKTVEEGDYESCIYTDNKLPRNNSYYSDDNTIIGNNRNGMSVYPYCSKKDGLMMTFKEAKNYLVLNPGDEYVFPVMVRYKLTQGHDPEQDLISHIEKTLSFDVRTSLYNDPLNYTFKIAAKYTDDTQDKLARSLTRKYRSTVLKNKEYTTIIG